MSIVVGQWRRLRHVAVVSVDPAPAHVHASVRHARSRSTSTRTGQDVRGAPDITTVTGGHMEVPGTSMDTCTTRERATDADILTVVCIET